MTNWLSIAFFIIVFISYEMVIYILYLLSKALKIYIRKNSNSDVTAINEETKKPKVGFISIAIFNVIVVAFILAMPYIQKTHDIYNSENVIICSSENDVYKFTELLDGNNIDYKILGDTKVKLQNKKDFTDAESIIQENCINYSVLNVID